MHNNKIIYSSFILFSFIFLSPHTDLYNGVGRVGATPMQEYWIKLYLVWNLTAQKKSAIHH